MNASDCNSTLQIHSCNTVWSISGLHIGSHLTRPRAFRGIEVGRGGREDPCRVFRWHFFKSKTAGRRQASTNHTGVRLHEVLESGANWGLSITKPWWRSTVRQPRAFFCSGIDLALSVSSVRKRKQGATMLRDRSSTSRLTYSKTTVV